MKRNVTFRPSAEADLFDLYDFIAGREGSSRAIGYIDRIEQAYFQLAEFPERGRSRPDLYPGLRILGFERRVSIAFVVEEKSVRVVRVLYGGRLFPVDWEV